MQVPHCTRKDGRKQCTLSALFSLPEHHYLILSRIAGPYYPRHKIIFRHASLEARNITRVHQKD
jgi:hypothetical protein